MKEILGFWKKSYPKTRLFFVGAKVSLLYSLPVRPKISCSGVLFLLVVAFFLLVEEESVMIRWRSLLIWETGTPFTRAAVSKSVIEYPWACTLSQKACICSLES
ncbi:MAG: hypothetical protein ACFNX7_03390 [Capnocytophaga gingivalis]